MSLIFDVRLIMQKRALLVLLSFLMLAPSVRAEEAVRYYDIETIIFESLDPSARQSENWKSDINRQIPAVSIELNQPYPGAMPPDYDPKLTFKTLPSSQFQLQQEEKLLTDTRQYRILLHTAWVQPGMGPDVALPVHIQQSYLAEAPISGTLVPGQGMPAANVPLPTAPTQTRSTLDGYIKIILTRYLHADVDLVYTTGLPVNPQTATNNAATGAPASDATTAGTPIDSLTTQPAPVIYRLLESRRMRSKELHYLDHPVLGMLVLITPYEGKTPTPLRKSR
ncbi:MAG: hypothetical protein GC149_00450 [Gammaproteobacteria bacterium]|nr:hypothetical protein [Gammaproteobacteria bacterium]